jgi:hypothetical protein
LECKLRKNERDKYLGMTNVNNQSCEMTIVEYIDSKNIVVEFNDEYKNKKHCKLVHFKNGQVRNPYFKSVLGIGIAGDKYPTSINGKKVKEYET